MSKLVSWLEARRWMLEEKRPSNAGFQLKPAVGGSSFYDKHRYKSRRAGNNLKRKLHFRYFRRLCIATVGSLKRSAPPELVEGLGMVCCYLVFL